MTTRLEKYERRLASAREFERMKKYLSLFGIGFALWINYLLDLALVKVRKAEGIVFSLFSRHSQPKIAPVLEYLNGASFILFLAFTAWLVYWAYMDTYVRKAQGKVTWSFRKKFLIGVIVNTVTYGILRISTYYVFRHIKHLPTTPEMRSGPLKTPPSSGFGRKIISVFACFVPAYLIAARHRLGVHKFCRSRLNEIRS